MRARSRLLEASTAAAFLFAATYAILQVYVALARTPDPLGLALIVAPSIVLGLSFVPMAAAWHADARASDRAWSLTAFGFAIAYTALVTFVYLVQLAILAPAQAAGEGASVAALTMTPGRILTGADAMGYVLQLLALAAMGMSLAPRTRLERWTRRALLANAVAAPGVALAVGLPWALVWGMLWLVTVPGSLALLWRSIRVSGAAEDTASPPARSVAT